MEHSVTGYRYIRSHAISIKIARIYVHFLNVTFNIQNLIQRKPKNNIALNIILIYIFRCPELKCDPPKPPHPEPIPSGNTSLENFGITVGSVFGLLVVLAFFFFGKT